MQDISAMVAGGLSVSMSAALGVSIACSSASPHSIRYVTLYNVPSRWWLLIRLTVGG